MLTAYRLSLFTVVCGDGCAGMREPWFFVVRASKSHWAGDCWGPSGAGLPLSCADIPGTSVGRRRSKTMSSARSLGCGGKA